MVAAMFGCMAINMTSRGLVQLWLAAVATTPKSISTSQESFRARSPSFGIATHGRRAQRRANRWGGKHHRGPSCALSVLNIMPVFSGDQSVKLLQMHLKHEMWLASRAVPNEIQGTSDTCHAFWDAAAAPWGPNSRKGVRW